MATEQTTRTEGFTPGPWEAQVLESARWKRRGYIRAASGFQVGYAHEDVRRMRVGESEANARLLAAAPDLYAVCKRWVTAIGESRAYPEERKRLLEDTRAALRKAVPQ